MKKSMLFTLVAPPRSPGSHLFFSVWIPFIAVLLFCITAYSVILGVNAKAYVCVKYGPCPLEAKYFECSVLEGSFVRQVCFDASRRFLVIKLNDTWYPYCDVDARTVQELLSAPSYGRFYNENIRSKSGGAFGPFDCRNHQMPAYP